MTPKELAAYLRNIAWSIENELVPLDEDPSYLEEAAALLEAMEADKEELRQQRVERQEIDLADESYRFDVMHGGIPE